MTDVVEQVLERLKARGLTLAVAEGDTGGVLLERLTSVAGSSAVVLGGVVAYHDNLKRLVLGVDPELLRAHGAVSAEVAGAMAAGVQRVAQADVGVATTGIAGPGGATDTKPVGLAYVAVASADRTHAREHRWRGDRAENRNASANAALGLILEVLLKNSDN